MSKLNSNSKEWYWKHDAVLHPWSGRSWAGKWLLVSIDCTRYLVESVCDEERPSLSKTERGVNLCMVAKSSFRDLLVYCLSCAQFAHVFMGVNNAGFPLIMTRNFLRVWKKIDSVWTTCVNVYPRRSYSVTVSKCFHTRKKLRDCNWKSSIRLDTTTKDIRTSAPTDTSTKAHLSSILLASSWYFFHGLTRLISWDVAESYTPCTPKKSRLDEPI